MFCPKCGVENPEDSLFCSKCGAKLSVTNEETKTNLFTEIVNKLKTFLNKRNIIIICSAIAIILASTIYLNNPVSKFKSDIRSNNYVEANELYRDKIKGNTDKEGTIISFSGGDYEFIGNASDVNIVPGSRFGDNVGWSLDETHGIAKVLACVKSATFYDGTTWDNPYYEYWIEQYKEKPFN